VKRRAFKLLLFVLAGAIINVAVAWGCAQWSESSHTLSATYVEALRSADNAAALFLNAEESAVLMSGFRFRPFRYDRRGTRIWGEPGPDPEAQIAIYISVGWPCQSLYTWQEVELGRAISNKWNWLASLPQTGPRGSPPLPRYHELPLIPLFPGFAINTIFYAAIVWVLFITPRAIRKRVRRKRGQCAACGYSLRGITADKCPECGATA
jgi:hypothetical protein